MGECNSSYKHIGSTQIINNKESEVQHDLPKVRKKDKFFRCMSLLYFAEDKSNNRCEYNKYW